MFNIVTTKYPGALPHPSSVRLKGPPKGGSIIDYATIVLNAHPYKANISQFIL